MSQPHIVLAITLAVPGGATSFVFDYAFWLKKRGFRVTVVAGEGSWLFERCTEVSIPCLRVPFLQREMKPWLDLPAFFNLIKLFHSLRPDVLHLNSSKIGVMGSIAGRLAHVPRIVYCIGGWAFLESIAPWKKRFYALAERLTGPCKDVIICLHPGDKQAAEARKIRPREQILVIPNGVDVQALDNVRLSRMEAREQLGVPQDQFVFGTIANFFPAKNLPHYLRKATPILKTFSSACIVLIGDGAERAQVEQVIRAADLSSQIILAGSRDNAHRFLSAFDVFVLPSTKEGMPFSLLEAMAARLPCIVTDVGAHTWMLAGTGSWVIPPNDQPALHHALTEALHDRGRLVDIGQANRTVVEQRFPVKKIFETQTTILSSPSQFQPLDPQP